MSELPAVTARRCLVQGLVQGVGFRYWTLREANRLDVVGWVRNVAEGVEVMIQGEERRVVELSALLYEGPRSAWVSSVECRDVQPDLARESFEIRP